MKQLMQRRSRSQLIPAVLALAALLALTGCSSSSKPGGQPATQPQPQEKITIVHWQHHHEARTPVVKELAAAFEQARPGVTIQFEAILYDNYFDKL